MPPVERAGVFDGVGEDRDIGESGQVEAAADGADGAILVRPDRFVAWRSIGSSPDPDTDLAAALSRVLGRDLTSIAAEDQLTATRS